MAVVNDCIGGVHLKGKDFKGGILPVHGHCILWRLRICFQ